MVKDPSRTSASILDEYCRYYSDFSKILDVYVKHIYPQFHFEFQQLLDASYNVWHRLSDADKVSLATFVEELNREGCSSLKTTTCDAGTHSVLNPKSLALNTSSNPKMSKTIFSKRASITPLHLFMRDERKKLRQSHSNMSMREINRRLSDRWQKMSKRMKYKYEYRSYLAKKRLYKKQGKVIQLKKPSFIKRMSSKTVQKHVRNSSRGHLAFKNK